VEDAAVVGENPVVFRWASPWRDSRGGCPYAVVY
jgi:hypothetical protein